MDPAAYPNKKTQRIIRKEARRMFEEDYRRIQNNIIANRPWYFPRFLWVRIVSIVLSRRGAGEG